MFVPPVLDECFWKPSSWEVLRLLYVRFTLINIKLVLCVVVVFVFRGYVGALVEEQVLIGVVLDKGSQIAQWPIILESKW